MKPQLNRAFIQALTITLIVVVSILPAHAGVITGSTSSEEFQANRDFAQRYNLVFDTNLAEGVLLQAEVSGEFSQVPSPETQLTASIPLNLERLELLVDQGTWGGRLGNRIRTTLDKYTIYDQEFAGVEAQVVTDNLGATLLLGAELENSSLVAAINSQYQLNPKLQIGGTVVALGLGEVDTQTVYGINSYFTPLPSLVIGAQYFQNNELVGGSALEIVAWTQLAGVTLRADLAQVDPNYVAPLANSAETYISGAKGYTLSAGTTIGSLGLSAEYSTHDYEAAAEKRVTKGVSAALPLIPQHLEVEANYRLVDVDALYSPSYASSTVGLGSKLTLTDQITLKAGYEVGKEGDRTTKQSVTADLKLHQTNVTAGYLYKEDALRQIQQEAGMEFGYQINDYTRVTAKYRLINFDNIDDSMDFKENFTGAELKLQF